MSQKYQNTDRSEQIKRINNKRANTSYTKINARYFKMIIYKTICGTA